MSLLGKASMVMTPNAVKESKVYSIIPSNGNGDLTFTRGTLASSTLTNDVGFIETVPYNLFSYSENFFLSNWTKSNISITSDSTYSPNNTLTADSLNIGIDVGSVRHRLSQNTPITLGTTYTTSYFLKKANQDWIQIVAVVGFSTGVWANFNLANGTIGNTGGVDTIATIEDYGNGWYRCTVSGVATLTGSSSCETVTTNNTNSGRYPSYQSLTAETVCYVWGAQFVQGSLPKNYFFTTDRLNVPRLNYDVVGGCPSLLLEPQRTNLIIQSEDFATGWNIEGLTVATNTINSPSGVQNADTVTETAVPDVHRIYRGAITITTGSNYTYSVYVKKNTQRYFRLVINNSSVTTSWVAAQFDLDTATFTSGVGSTNGTFVSASITAVDGSGWYRCTLVGSITATTAFAFIALSNGTAIVNTDNRGCIIYLGNVLNKLNLWGAQFELGAYVTSYIPTTTGIVTRNSDAITRNNIYTNGLITSVGGTWFIEINNNIPLTRDGTGFILLGDASSLSGNCFAFRGFGARIAIVKIISNTPTTLFTTLTNIVKIAIKWSSSTNTADVFVNGTKEVNATLFTATALEFLNGNGGDIPKYIKSMYLFPTPLTDTECIAITT